MEKSNRSRNSSNFPLALRLSIAAFVVIIAILLVVAVVILVTQSPLDLNKFSASPAELETNKSQTLQFRRLKPKQPSYRKFSLDDLFSGKLFVKDQYSVRWRKNGSILRRKDEYFLIDSTVNTINPETFAEEPFLKDDIFMDTLSSDENYAYDRRVQRSVYRHSHVELLEIVKIVNKTVNRVTYPVGPKSAGNETISLFVWSPNPKNHDFVFVHDYNIYYQSDPEKPGSAVQLTEHGERFLTYGVTDWLYEEEVFASNKAIWWSQSGRYISYMRFDDRKVNKVFFPKYTSSHQYPQYEEIAYPKAGVVENPHTTLYIYDKQTNKAVVAYPPVELTAFNQSGYVFSNTWLELPAGLGLGSERLLTVWSNREQNTIYLTLCNETDCIMTYMQTFTLNGRSIWAEPTDFHTILQTKKGFFILLPRLYTDGNIYNHAAHIEIQSSGVGKVTGYIGGSYDIRELKAYNTQNDVLSFVTAGGQIGARKLYRATKATTKSSIEDISSLLPNCAHTNSKVPPQGNIATISCLQPFDNTRLWIIDLINPSKHKLLDGNEKVFLPFDKPELSFETIKLESGYDINVGMMTPPKFDPTRKYPVIVDVYGGPGSTRVKRSTPSPNMIYYCSTYEVIILWIDGRGTGDRGWNIRAPVYKVLGQFEALDTLDTIQELMKKYKFIDEKRIGIFGWSYGGFLATHIATKDRGQTVKCAVAVAPVTDLILYDSAYTERYMGMPLENPKGYNMSRLTSKANLMQNVKYMLIHGEADDNVHYQHSALMSEALHDAMIHFTQIVYANQDHSMSMRQRHLFEEVGNYFAECFDLDHHEKS